MAVDILWRYSCKVNISKSQYQLIAITSLLIAAKFHEIYPPKTQKLLHVCEYAFTTKQVVEKEGEILSVLDYKLSKPNSISFLDIIASKMNLN